MHSPHYLAPRLRPLLSAMPSPTYPLGQAPFWHLLAPQPPHHRLPTPLSAPPSAAWYMSVGLARLFRLSANSLLSCPCPPRELAQIWTHRTCLIKTAPQ